MRTSLMRMTTKTNLPAPRHSNKHSPSEHLHRGENSPVFMCACVCVCFFAHPPPHVPMPVFLSGFSQGCWWKLKEQRCMLHPPFYFIFFFLFPAPEAPAPQLWGAVSSKGTVVCGPATSAEVFLYLIHFSISHPTKKKKNSLCKTYCCWRMYYVLVWTVFTLVLHTADMIKVFPDSQSVCFNTLC